MISSATDKKTADAIMTEWNSKQSEVSKLMDTGSRSAKPKKDPNHPKRWNTGYIIFCGEHRTKIKEKDPSLSATEVTTQLGKLWKELSEKEKKKYEEASKKDKSRYDKEMESYTPPEGFSDSEDKPKRGRGKRAERTGPKRPLSAYMFFCQDARAEVKSDHPDMDGKKVTLELGTRWNALTAEQKAPYDAKHQADKARYEAEKASATGDESSPAKTSGKGKKGAKADAKAETKTNAPADAPAKSKGKKGAKADAKAEPVKTDAPAKGRGRKKAEKPEDQSPPEPPVKGSKSGKKAVKNTPGYQYFVTDETDKLSSENPDWSSKKVETEVNKLWAQLCDEEREVYELEAQAQEEENDGSDVEQLEDE
jgi:hypothetical protein